MNTASPRQVLAGGRSRAPREWHRTGPHRTPHRRHVAVLFADISGFTRLVDAVDPETVYSIVRPLLDDLMRLVRRWDGEVQQMLGDGFMAVFGLHSTEGDVAANAVRAAREVVASGGGPRPAVHVGVEYGEVLVTPSWEPAAYGVWGRAVNHARRLCESAGAGELWLGPAVLAAVGDQDRAAAHHAA